MMFCRVLILLAHGVSLLFIALAVLFVLAGGDLMQPLGVSLFEINRTGINVFQVIIQRYIHPGLWSSVFVPILQLSAIIVFAVGLIVPQIFLKLGCFIIQKRCASCSK